MWTIPGLLSPLYTAVLVSIKPLQRFSNELLSKSSPYFVPKNLKLLTVRTRRGYLSVLAMQKIPGFIPIDPFSHSCSTGKFRHDQGLLVVQEYLWAPFQPMGCNMSCKTLFFIYLEKNDIFAKTPCLYLYLFIFSGKWHGFFVFSFYYIEEIDVSQWNLWCTILVYK